MGNVRGIYQRVFLRIFFLETVVCNIDNVYG